jgi:acetylornithine/N-succinyldiaminopimelate aminotransferase
MVGADLSVSAPELARRALLEQRLVLNATGPETIRLEPPLVIGAAEVDEALSRLAALGSDVRTRMAR